MALAWSESVVEPGGEHACGVVRRGGGGGAVEEAEDVLACPGVRVRLPGVGRSAGMAGASFGELAGFAADPLEEGVVEAVEGGLVAVVLQAFGVELEAEGGGEFVEVDAWPAFAGEFVRDSPGGLRWASTCR